MSNVCRRCVSTIGEVKYYNYDFKHTGMNHKIRSILTSDVENRVKKSINNRLFYPTNNFVTIPNFGRREMIDSLLLRFLLQRNDVIICINRKLKTVIPSL